MSQGNVKSLELEAFKRKLQTLAALPQNSDTEFAEAIYTATARFGITETQFRDTFGLTKGAVERWTTLKNLPQPDVRPKIIEWILQTL
ncbi:MAG: hypothetical protein K0R10_939 [Alphaproteobacteria bacterium]|jgi:hypothetical protein|nr:hypothetical protein [Alphaproteobacteria bacterium]